MNNYHIRILIFKYYVCEIYLSLKVNVFYVGAIIFFVSIIAQESIICTYIVYILQISQN